MLGDQACEIEPDRRTIDDAPFARDHHPVGAMRAAQNERRERIMRAREARLVELEEREIRLMSLRDPANVGTSEAAGGAFAFPSAARRDG